MGAAQNNEERHEISIPIPSLPSTSPKSCCIISIWYYIRIEAKVGSRHHPHVEIPIVIGNVPLQWVPNANQNVAYSSAPNERILHILPTTPEAPSAPADSPEVSGLGMRLPHESYANLGKLFGI